MGVQRRKMIAPFGIAFNTINGVPGCRRQSTASWRLAARLLLRIPLTAHFTTLIDLDACVEETQRVEELLVHGGVAGDAQLVVVQLEVRALQVCLVPMVPDLHGLKKNSSRMSRG